MNLSLNQTLKTFLLYLRQTWMTQLILAVSVRGYLPLISVRGYLPLISVRGYLPLIQKDSTNHVNGLAVYLKEGLPFARDLFLENCRKVLTYVFNSLYFTQYLTSFSCIDHLLFLMHGFLFYFI